MSFRSRRSQSSWLFTATLLVVALLLAPDRVAAGDPAWIAPRGG